MSGDLAVQYAKLPEWLLARRVIPENYALLLTGVDARVAEALAEAVSDETARALINEHRDAMTYFAAKEIYGAVAKSPEGQTKSFLGSHTHLGAAKWKAVVDAYNRKHLSWISTSRALIQNVSYEVPALKKQMDACQRQISECSQRQTELVRTEASAKNRYETLLQDLGIHGFNPRQELEAHAAEELPKQHVQLADLLKSVGGDLAEYYQAFASHAGGTKLEDQLLPIIRLIASKGSSIRVEDIEKEVPALHVLRETAPRTGATKSAMSTDKPCGESSVAAEADGATADIDWGFEVVSGAEGASGGGIDWDFDIAVAEDGGSGVVGATADVAEIGAGTNGNGIDWGSISFEGVEMETQGALGESTGDGLFGDPHARELLVQEVAEVGAFLQTRCAELSVSSNEDCGPKSSQKSLREVQTLADVTHHAEELLSGRKTQRLLMLRSSARYLDQQVKRVESAKAQCVKPVTQRASLDKVKAEQSDEAKRTRTEIDKLRTATHKVQKELEAELSAHFKSNVRIVGEIAAI